MENIRNAIKLVIYYLVGGAVMWYLLGYVEFIFEIKDPNDMQALAFIGAILTIFGVTWRAR